MTELPAFRSAVRRRRCLVPADGWYEWAPRPDGAGRQPTYLTPLSGDVVAFAGLYEIWGPDRMLTSSIVTTAANAVLAPIHDRMPVILDSAAYDRWLDPGQAKAEELLRPCPDEWLEAFPVSTQVNNVRNDVAELIAPMNPA